MDPLKHPFVPRFATRFATNNPGKSSGAALNEPLIMGDVITIVVTHARSVGVYKVIYGGAQNPEGREFARGCAPEGSH